MKSSDIPNAQNLLRERGYVQQFILNASVPAEEHGHILVAIGGEEIDISAEHSHVIVVEAEKWARIRLTEIDRQLGDIGVEIDTDEAVMRDAA